ncbi:acyltransferase family protein [Streptomyces sp. NPDC018031]|uniref:acyltransferase family protein n=1 Tax=Streptomyces sp. NPDC018031 TaxID=3365033 RepID=UPI0037A5F8BE
MRSTAFRGRPPSQHDLIPVREPRLAALDGLRILAALMVVAYHYMAFASGAWPEPVQDLFPHAYLPASYGWLGVQLFFLISGFVICMSCWGKSVGDFGVSRAARLYPAYWFAVLATALVVTVWPPPGTEPLSLGDVGANLTMFHEPMGVDPVDGVYWTLWVEMRFYLLFALVVWKGLDYRRTLAFCVLWAVAGFMALELDNEALDLLVMPSHCWYFIAGIAFYLMYRFGPNLLLWGVVAGCFLVSQDLLMDAHERAEGYVGHTMPQWPTAVLLALFFAALAAVALGYTGRIRWRWLSTAGALTYPLYLIHERIGWVVIEHTGDRLPPPALLLLLVSGMLGAAWLVQRWIERPLARALRGGLRIAVTQVRVGSRPPLPRPEPAPKTPEPVP